MLLLELVRWRSVLLPIARGMRLGVAKWLQIFVGTLRTETIYQQIDIGFEQGKWLSHSFVMWGFILLGVSTTLNYIYNPKGDPLPIWHSVRIAGNIGGLLFVTGLAIIVLRYRTNTVKRESTSASDYLFAFLLLAAGATGFASEFANELNVGTALYSIYVTHLIFCAALLITAPFTKFIHAIGRPVLRLSENYLTALDATKSSPTLTPLPKVET